MSASSDFSPVFGLIVEHPGYRGTFLMVLGEGDQGRARAIVLADADKDQYWETGSIQLISCRGWIIHDAGIEA